MKIALVLCLTLLIAGSLSTAGPAQDVLKVRGVVLTINAAAKSVTIQPREGASVTVVLDGAAMLSRVKEGDKAEATSVVKQGVNAGSCIRMLIEGCN